MVLQTQGKSLAVPLLLLVIQSTATNLATEAFFIGQDGELETLRIIATAVGDIEPSALRRDGWAFGAFDHTIDRVLSRLSAACPDTTSAPMLTQCINNYFGTQQGEAHALGRQIKAQLLQALLPADRDRLDISCHLGPEVVVFLRGAAKPQNMHWDTNEEEHDGCAAMTASSDHMVIRAWLPVQPVVRTAPLLLSNTTGLYSNACARRVQAEPGQSPSWRIFSATDFLRDCGERGRRPAPREGQCAWIHTLGMKRGEVLLFRNAMVMHGSSSAGAEERATEAGRVSIAVDCVTRNLHEDNAAHSCHEAADRDVLRSEGKAPEFVSPTFN